MSVCIFEDQAVSNLYPLTYLQSPFDLRCGMFTIRERIAQYFPTEKIFLLTRKQLESVMRERAPDCFVNVPPDEPTLFINGRLLLDPTFSKSIHPFLHQEVLFHCGEEIVAISTSNETVREVWKALREQVAFDVVNKYDTRSVCGKMIQYPWDLIAFNHEMLTQDALRFPNRIDNEWMEQFPHVVFLEPKNISLGKNCRLQPGVVLNAEAGPIILGDGVTIMSHAVVTGPAFIGAGSVIKMGAKIYENVSIGPVCKVGGEVVESIIHSYANKPHDGFLGHSYLASWTNLGADTNTSNLKNTYDDVRMTLEGKEFSTGMKFLGLVIADHSKCGINTMFNTGTCVGVHCNVFGAGYPPKFLPSFSWGGAEGLREYHLRKSIPVMRAVMARRSVFPTTAEEELTKIIFEETRHLRKDFVH